MPDDPGPAFETVTIYGFNPDRKLAAIKFIRNLKRVRDKGITLGLREAKELADGLQNGSITRINFVAVPNYLIPMLTDAARYADVRLTPDPVPVNSIRYV